MSPSSSSSKHVRFLYKTILRLHRGLPAELKILGDEYVKEEFHRHKNANVEQAGIFLNEWTNYAVHLSKQLMDANRGANGNHLGINLTEKQLEMFQDQQLGQLYELQQEVLKPHSSKSGENTTS